MKDGMDYNENTFLYLCFHVHPTLSCSNLHGAATTDSTNTQDEAKGIEGRFVLMFVLSPRPPWTLSFYKPLTTNLSLLVDIKGKKGKCLLKREVSSI